MHLRSIARDEHTPVVQPLSRMSTISLGSCWGAAALGVRVGDPGQVQVLIDEFRDRPEARRAPSRRPVAAATNPHPGQTHEIFYPPVASAPGIRFARLRQGLPRTNHHHRDHQARLIIARPRPSPEHLRWACCRPHLGVRCSGRPGIARHGSGAGCPAPKILVVVTA